MIVKAVEALLIKLYWAFLIPELQFHRWSSLNGYRQSFGEAKVLLYKNSRSAYFFLLHNYRLDPNHIT